MPEDSSKQIAQQLLDSLAELTAGLSRLEQRQIYSNASIKDFRSEIEVFRARVQKIEQDQVWAASEVKDISRQLGRIEKRLEDAIEEECLPREEFHEYLVNLQESTLKKRSQSWRQIGIVGGGMLAGAGVVFPLLRELVAWIIENL